MPSTSQTLIREKLQNFDRAVIEPHFSELNRQLGAKCDAILAYGSTLSNLTRSTTSTPDFYLIVRSYSHFHVSKVHALLNWFLPPNIYHFDVNGAVAKYNVLSAKDLAKETSRCTPDCYNLGRMSKRLAIGWARDESAVDEIVRAQASAVRTIAEKVFYLMPREFSLEDFVKKAIRFSYMADVRVEAEDKVDRLYSADHEYYLAIYRDTIETYLVGERKILKNRGEKYEKTNGSLHDRWGLSRTNWFLQKSKLRAQMRWPKGIFTVKGWVDYVLAKVERTQGIKLEISEHEKRYWYIYGWKYFFRLRRKNLIK